MISAARINVSLVTPRTTAAAATAVSAPAALLGVSNHWAWRVERARSLAAAAGVPGYEVLQHYYSYLRPRTDLPGPLSPDGEQGVLGGDLLRYLRAEPLPARPGRPDQDHERSGRW